MTAAQTRRVRLIPELGDELPRVPDRLPDEQFDYTDHGGTHWRVARYDHRIFRIADPDEVTPVPLEDLHETPGHAAAWYASQWYDRVATIPRRGDLIEVERPGDASLFLRIHTASGSHDDGWTVSGMVSFQPGGPIESVTRYLISGPASFTWLDRKDV
ncbi:hypothetical protein I0C86_40605 [Plantactinospora sp. S1510]|uniref:Uncharacterized protein n=1 Tax=Plantactinospora alkalitolerans TaxID=2789879 RepID=A0ABS0H9L8_9ACTN|nr:hypothetical protein [Plantactinospora alkalitolerans]MBF9135182.1 hypothetical protein [Plantactinospora alkalitolerans]